MIMQLNYHCLQRIFLKTNNKKKRRKFSKRESMTKTMNQQWLTTKRPSHLNYLSKTWHLRLLQMILKSYSNHLELSRKFVCLKRSTPQIIVVLVLQNLFPQNKPEQHSDSLNTRIYTEEKSSLNGLSRIQLIRKISDYIKYTLYLKQVICSLINIIVYYKIKNIFQ